MMRLNTRSPYLLLLSLAALIGCDRADPVDVSGVEAAFEGYRTAALAADGETAVQHISQRTLDAFEVYRTQALTADGATVRVLPVMDRLMVATLRVQVGAERLSAMNGRDLFVYTVSEGMVGETSMRTAQMEAVRIDGDSAVADFVARGPRAPILEFHREDGAWKWDMMPVMDLGSEAFAEQARQAGMDVDELIFMSLSILAGEPIDESIYDSPASEPR